MVRDRLLLQIAAAIAMIAPVAFGDISIQSVRVASDTAIRIKPCEPLFLLMDVTVRSSTDPRKMREVPPELARDVVVNGRSYGARMRCVNSVAGFILNRGSIKTIAQDNASFQTVVVLHWNPEDGDYLFNKPGLYQVQFGPWSQVDVIVEEPTEKEREIVSQIQDLGLEFAMFIMSPSDNCGAKLSHRVEQMLEKYPDTAYSGYMSIALGMNKLRGLQPAPDMKLKTFLLEQAKLGKYFEPYCTGEIKSPLEAAAAYRLATIALDLARADPEDKTQGATISLREVTVLLEKVKSSPYSLDYASKAAAKLAALDK